MRIVVIGAGVVGTTLAFELMRDGHDVTVLERNDKPAEGTSYANAGLIAPGHSFTWASPKAPKVLLKSLFSGGQALALQTLGRSLTFGSGWLKFLGECTASRGGTQHADQTCVVPCIPRSKLARLTEETGVGYHHIDKGICCISTGIPASYRRRSGPHEDSWPMTARKSGT